VCMCQDFLDKSYKQYFQYPSFVPPPYRAIVWYPILFFIL